MKDWNKNEIFRVSKADFILGKVKDGELVENLKFPNAIEEIKRRR